MTVANRLGLLVLARPTQDLGSLGSPVLQVPTRALGLTGVAPVLPVGSAVLSVPTGALAFVGRPASLNPPQYRLGLLGLASSHRTVGQLVDPAAVSVSDIDGTAATQYLRSSAVVSGLHFNATQSGGTVTIGGVPQPVLNWSDTAITIGPIDRGTLQYGSQLLVVTNGATGRTGSLSITLQPQSGWSYVNLGVSNSDVNALIPTSPALTASTDYSERQVAYGNFLPPGPGYSIVYADATFAYGNGLASFDAEMNDGSGWGTTGTQEFNVSATPAAVALGLTGYAPTLNQSTNTFLTPPTRDLGLTGVAPTEVETTSRVFVIPSGALHLVGYKQQGRSMYGLGSGGLGTGGLGGRDRTGLTAGTGVSENVQ